MQLRKPGSDLFIPDGIPTEAALARTTHLGIGAHQDDLEFFAIHGILECFQNPDRWFTGITVTDGAGSARSGAYAKVGAAEMIAIRRDEQRKAAMLGQYGAMIQLPYTSAEVKDLQEAQPTDDLTEILNLTRPEVVYLHNPADKHESHIAVLRRSIEAIRRLPATARPGRVYGCEVWRDLDWVPDHRKVALPVGAHPDLQEALNRVFDSQISGGKRYDLAVMGRRLAHATFYESHAVDAESGFTFAVDLTPVCQEGGPSLEAFTETLLTEFREEVMGLLGSVKV